MPESDVPRAEPTWSSRLSLRIRLIAVLAGCVALTAGGVVVHEARGELPKGVAFDGSGIREDVSGVRHRAAVLRALYGVEVPTGERERDRFWRDVAQSMVVSEVLEAAAAERGIDVTDVQAEEALQTYVLSSFGEGDAATAAYHASLGRAGTSAAEVMREIRRQLVVAALFEETTAGVAQPTEAEVRAAFDSWRCHLGTPERRRLRNIVVVRRQEARRILRSLDRGGSFLDLARARSSDTSTSARGGTLGLRSEDELEPAYGRAAFAARPHRPFGPVRTERGWNVGVVTRIVPAAPADFGQVRAQVADRVLGDRRQAAWRAWITKALASAEVRYAEQYRPERADDLPEAFETPSTADRLEACPR